jgi:hypothetical protein
MSQLKWWKLPNRHAHCQINPPLPLTAAQQVWFFEVATQVACIIGLLLKALFHLVLF